MKPLRVLVLFDTPEQVYSPEGARDYLRYPDWSDEKDVINSLRRLGHAPVPYAVCDDLPDLMRHIEQVGPDLVFFMCETFAQKRELEAQLVGILELLGIPHSGAGSSQLQICKNKETVKHILSGRGIKVPQAFVLPSSGSVSVHSALNFPLIVKPVNRDASEGISLNSVVSNRSDLEARASYLIRKFGCDVICEQFIDGREFYVGVLGNEDVECLYPVELKFPADGARILTYKSKWDEAYRRKKGIRSTKARLSEFEIRRLQELSAEVYQALGLRGYARIDWRQDHHGAFYCLEANPNPAISKDDDFAKGAAHAGLRYDQLITRILELGLEAWPDKSVSGNRR